VPDAWRVCAFEVSLKDSFLGKIKTEGPRVLAIRTVMGVGSKSGVPRRRKTRSTIANSCMLHRVRHRNSESFFCIQKIGGCISCIQVLLVDGLCETLPRTAVRLLAYPTYITPWHAPCRAASVPTTCREAITKQALEPGMLLA
jgi:hypothetical protein